MGFETSLAFVTSPAFLSLSADAARLWLLVACYVDQHQTNVTPAVLRLFGKESTARELVTAGFWVQQTGGWEVVKQESELTRKRRAAGRQGGLAKASKPPSKTLANTVANGLANSDFASLANAGLVPPLASPSPDSESGLGLKSPADSPSFQPLSEGSEPSPARAPKRRMRRCPDAFELDETGKKLCTELRVDWSVEGPKFHDWEFKDPKSDWQATARTWIRNAAAGPRSDASLPPRNRPVAASADERTRARNNLLDDARAGRAGPRAQAWAESGQNLGKLADELEVWERRRRDKQLGQQIAPLLEGVGR